MKIIITSLFLLNSIVCLAQGRSGELGDSPQIKDGIQNIRSGSKEFRQQHAQMAKTAQMGISSAFSNSAACYRSLRLVSYGLYLEFENSGNIMLPAKRNNLQGFYMITDQGGVFHPFAKQPASSGMSYYFYELPIRSQSMQSNSIFVTYSYNPDPANAPGIAYGPDPIQEHPATKIQLGNEVPDPEALGALTDDLLKRIQTVNMSYKGELKAPVNYRVMPDEAAAQAAKLRNKHLSALDGCAAVQDSRITKAITEERQKFGNTPFQNSIAECLKKPDCARDLQEILKIQEMRVK